MQNTLILILITLWLVIAAGCGVTGFFIGVKYSRKKAEPRATSPLSAEEIHRAKRIQAEYDNMMNYTGSIQEDISV